MHTHTCTSVALGIWINFYLNLFAIALKKKESKNPSGNRLAYKTAICPNPEEIFSIILLLLSGVSIFFHVLGRLSIFSLYLFLYLFADLFLYF